MTAAEWVARAKGVVPSSESATRILNLLGKQDTSNDAIVKAIRCDGPLTAKLLQVCNSPMAGLKSRIATVDQAVLLLGYREVFKLVMAISYSATMAAPIPGYAVAEKEFWKQSIATAAAAECITDCGIWHGDGIEFAFTAGLLQDVGELVIGRAINPDIVEQMRSKVESGAISRIEAEREMLGTDHAEIGASLLKSWNLPEDLVEAVAHHHQPILEPFPKLSIVTHLADGLAHLAGGAPGWGSYAVRISSEAVDKLGLDTAHLESMVISARTAIDRLEKFTSGL